MKNPFRNPTALEMATQQFEQAQRNLLTASEHREHYVAMELMLRERILRLRSDITNLTKENLNETPS